MYCAQRTCQRHEYVAARCTVCVVVGVHSFMAASLGGATPAVIDNALVHAVQFGH
jgi:hypothetical protein